MCMCSILYFFHFLFTLPVSVHQSFASCSSCSSCSSFTWSHLYCILPLCQLWIYRLEVLFWRLNWQRKRLYHAVRQT
ncbi:hypothetical protein F4820DRAFT_229078 [Hypoxylon rubiginosum]|uniref:Uncharacterized protein n=1 Tax=Hypoxylon rubiginosum TaxID=110542 RepID=A0ACB9Z7X4_9PEZI|nr:hypothetical protein F4820DRAFT_229078 [Hypoxylon rubiginosum]